MIESRSNGVFDIVINKTNETFRFLKPIRLGFHEIFHLTIRFTNLLHSTHFDELYRLMYLSQLL
jgi:hypothetical protein